MALIVERVRLHTRAPSSRAWMIGLLIAAFTRSARRSWPEVFCGTARMKGGQAVEGGARVLGAPLLER